MFPPRRRLAHFIALSSLLLPRLGAPLPEVGAKQPRHPQRHDFREIAPNAAPDPSSAAAAASSAYAAAASPPPDSDACYGGGSRSTGRCVHAIAQEPSPAPRRWISCHDVRSCGLSLVALAALPLGAAVGASWWRARPYMLRERVARQRLARWLPEDDPGWKCVDGCLRKKYVELAAERPYLPGVLGRASSAQASATAEGSTSSAEDDIIAHCVLHECSGQLGPESRAQLRQVFGHRQRQASPQSASSAHVSASPPLNTPPSATHDERGRESSVDGADRNDGDRSNGNAAGTGQDVEPDADGANGEDGSRRSVFQATRSRLSGTPGGLREHMARNGAWAGPRSGSGTWASSPVALPHVGAH